MMPDATGSARWRGQPIEAVLFDLDGTLLDTAADIALALNRTLAEYGWNPAAQDDVRRMIGRGAPMLIQRTAAAQGRTLDDASLGAMAERFFHQPLTVHLNLASGRARLVDYADLYYGVRLLGD